MSEAQAGSGFDAETIIDVAVIGAGVAGLSAALQLGRARKRVWVFDGGAQRNHMVAHSHGWLTHDGASPAELYQQAWRDLGHYPHVERVQAQITRLEQIGDNWRLDCEGQESVTARRVILATGVRDELLPIPGLQARLGHEVQLCPYCHAYEWRDQPLGILMPDPAMLGHLGPLLREWTADLLVFSQDQALSPEIEALLASLGAKLYPGPVAAVSPQSAGLELELASGERHWVQGLFTQPRKMHQTPLIAPLISGQGLALTELGFLQVDGFGATSLPGLFAAGDNCSPMHSLTLASASGAMAGFAAHRSLVFAQGH